MPITTKITPPATTTAAGPVRVVLVDDDEDDYLITRSLLGDIPGKTFEVTWIGAYDRALRYLGDCPLPDIFFFDYRLGAKTGVDLIHAVRRRWTDVPVVVLTGKGDLRMDQEAMDAGATDYLVKSELDPDKLERCIRYALDRAKTQRALRENEAKYRGIFEKTQNMIYVVDAAGRIVDVNPAATSLLGYARDEFLSMPDRSLFYQPELREAFAGRLLEQGETREFEALFRTRDGEARQCLLSAILQRNGDDYQFHVMVQDVTGRRRAELIRLLSEKLATVGRFVRALAHEVRNPLTNIDLSIEAIESENTNRELDELIAIVKRNSLRIGDLITELLNVARKPELTKAPTSIRQLLSDTLDTAADRAKLKNIRIENEWPDQDLVIPADAPKLRMALLNLVTNALEAMEAGQGVLTLGFARHGEECCISVEDNGCGIPEENKGRLFDPYFTGKPRGMGLGLTTVLNIVQSHGGTVNVESQPGQGARFEVWLPVGD